MSVSLPVNRARKWQPINKNDVTVVSGSQTIIKLLIYQKVLMSTTLIFKFHYAIITYRNRVYSRIGAYDTHET